VNKRLKRGGIGLGISAVVIAPAVLALSHWINDPVTGTAHTGSTVSTAASSPLASLNEAAPNTLTTPYFSTTLPSGFAVKRQTKASDAGAPIQFEAVALSARTKDEQFAVTVGNLTSGGLQDIGDYHLRSMQASSYHSFTTTGMPSGARGFQTVNGAPGFTVFSTQGSHYIEVTMSTDGGATLSQLQEAYAQIMNSWQ
jgi:hypothetical protein